jgi:hypothetical protein
MLAPFRKLKERRQAFHEREQILAEDARKQKEFDAKTIEFIESLPTQYRSRFLELVGPPPWPTDPAALDEITAKIERFRMEVFYPTRYHLSNRLAILNPSPEILEQLKKRNSSKNSKS